VTPEMASVEQVEQRDEELKSTGYEIFIGFLSILSILNVALIYLADDPNLDTVIYALNGLFSVVFLADFTYRSWIATPTSSPSTLTSATRA